MSLNGFRVAILVADGFEQVEMTEPRKALEHAGAKTTLVSPVKDKVKGWENKNWGKEFPVELDIEAANAADFDGLLLPGGVINPDKLRGSKESINFIKKFVHTDKPIGAICHGPWTLIDAEGVKGKTVTSAPSIKIDLVNAGANWVDQEVAKDYNLVTSRKPADIPAFNKALIGLFASVSGGR